MKQILTIFSLFFVAVLNAQINLCEENSYMYSKCYELNTDSTFTYSYSHCTGTQFGIGRYKANNNKIEFSFDSIKLPSVKSMQTNLLNNIVNIYYHHHFYNSAMYFATIKYNGNVFYINGEGNVSINYSGGPITIFQSHHGDSLIIHPDKESKNEYYIRWVFSGDSIVKIGTIFTMKKKSNRYRFVEKYSTAEKRKITYYAERLFDSDVKDDILNIADLPYICHNFKSGAMGCGDSIFWKLVARKDLAIKPLINLIDDTTSTQMFFPNYGGQMTVGDIAQTVLSEIINDFPKPNKFFEINPINESIWMGNLHWLQSDPQNRIEYSLKLKKWYSLNKSKMKWVKSNAFNCGDISGEHPIGGHYQIRK